MTDIIRMVVSFIGFYKLVLVARILLTWLPNINWYNQPFKFLRDVTDPVMEPFRRLIPGVGGIDFSPILLFFLLDLLQQALSSLALH